MNLKDSDVKKIIFSGSLIIVLCCWSFASFGQSKRAYKTYTRKKPTVLEAFLDTQWWLGMKTGLNLTEAVPQKRYAIFSPVNYEVDDLQKTYGQFNRIAMQAGLEVTFYHKGFSFSFQPNYNRQVFDYFNTYTWAHPELPEQSIELRYDHQVSLDFIELPLIIKYDVLRKGKIRPFVEAGGYYGILVGAVKDIATSGSDKASGSQHDFEGEKMVMGVKNLFRPSAYGVLGGVGVNYDLWKIRVVLDVVYRHGLNTITSGSNRYANHNLSGMGAVLDDISLNNLSCNIGFLFPLRFISSDFKAID